MEHKNDKTKTMHFCYQHFDRNYENIGQVNKTKYLSNAINL